MNVISRIAGAALRAVLVGLLIATPSLLLTESNPDTSQIVALIALFAAVLTFVEYAAVYPSIIEFRDAPPFNRVRFCCLFVTIFFLAVVMRGQNDPSGLTILCHAVGEIIGQSIDFPYSPVRLVLLGMGEGADPFELSLLRTAAGISYLVSLLSLAIFVLLLRLYGWPSRSGAFNVWINLPTFDPTTGGDVVHRLNRDARVNIALGFLLPFLIPAVAKLAGELFGPFTMTSSHTMIWTVAAWAFLPASLFMRGIAMGRIANMIEDKRRRSSLGATDGGLLVT